MLAGYQCSLHLADCSPGEHAPRRQSTLCCFTQLLLHSEKFANIINAETILQMLKSRHFLRNY